MVEQKNQSLVDIAKIMLKAKSLPNFFWVEVIHTTTYILNRSLIGALSQETPFEAWHGWKPKVTHLRIFRCVAHVHVPSQKRWKLDDNSIKYIFFGYSIDMKGCCLYDPIIKKLLISRDVVFDENSAWNWESLQSGQILEDGEFLNSPIRQ